ncbi:MAG: serine/threonine-protein kinase [Nannocystaceae bacterium]
MDPASTEPTQPGPDDPERTQVLDERMHAGRPQLGSALSELRSRVVAAVVHKHPSTVGRYVLGRTIGSGNFGTVFEAHDPKLDRRVALKLVAVRSEEQTARVVREARLLASLSHPNVVEVFEVGITEGPRPSPYVVMELVEGETVQQWLAAADRPWHEVVQVMLQAARGLAAAHAAGIVHRDFKPDNALLGTDGRVRVVDFGLARTVDETLDSTVTAEASLTRYAPLRTPTGGILGTPAYMAPEAFLGRVTPQADQYSLCVSLYEGLYGQRPIAAKSVDELRTALHRVEPTLPRGRRGVPPAIGAALMRGLSRDPYARFADLGELVTALEAGLRPPRRGLWAGVAAAAAAGLLAVGVAIANEPDAPVSTADNRAPNGGDAPDPSTAAAIATLEADAAGVRELLATSKVEPAMELSLALLRRAESIDHEPAWTEPTLLRGQALAMAANYGLAYPTIEIAYFLADDHDQPQLAAHAASELIGILGYYTDNYEKAHRWKDHADVAFGRAGLDPLEHVPYVLSVAGLMSREGDTEGAIELLSRTSTRLERRGLADVERTEPASGSARAALLGRLAEERFVLGHRDESVALLRKALPLIEAADGPRSMTYAAALDRLGVFLFELGRRDEALPLHEQALQIRVAVLDPEHLDVARSHGNIGRALGHLGRRDEAFEHLDRSMELFWKNTSASGVALGHQTKAEIHETRGAAGHADAIVEYTRAARTWDIAGVIYAQRAERMRESIRALGGTPPPTPSVAQPPLP